jgi:hypothetical protein
MWGSSTAMRASKSPSRAAARKASTTFLLCGRVGVGGRVRTADAAASAAGELARRVGQEVEDGADLVEGNREHVVEDVGEPLCRRQADGVGEQRLVLRVDAVCAVDHRVRQVCVEWPLASRLA